MSEQKPSIGRIVHYLISENDALRIRNWRDTANGSQGNASGAGDTVPLIIARVNAQRQSYSGCAKRPAFVASSTALNESRIRRSACRD